MYFESECSEIKDIYAFIIKSPIRIFEIINACNLRWIQMFLQ